LSFIKKLLTNRQKSCKLIQNNSEGGETMMRFTWWWKNSISDQSNKLSGFAALS
jgi:hypothetical protein